MPMPRRRAGFTFIEIMIVIVIIGVTAGVTIPRLKGSFGPLRIKAGARDVTGLLRYSRNCAVLREKPCALRFDPEKDTYELVLLDDGGEPEKTERRKRRGSDKNNISYTTSDDVGGLRTLPAKIHINAVYTAAPLDEDSGLPCVIFYGDGSATPATIVLSDESHHALNIEVFRTTGMARVEKGLPKQEPQHAQRYYGPKADQGGGS